MSLVRHVYQIKLVKGDALELNLLNYRADLVLMSWGFCLEFSMTELEKLLLSTKHIIGNTGSIVIDLGKLNEEKDDYIEFSEEGFKYSGHFYFPSIKSLSQLFSKLNYNCNRVNYLTDTKMDRHLFFLKNK